MNPLIQFMRSDISSILTTTLIHTLWQGTVIAVLLYFALRSITARHANTRYIVSLVAMYLIVLSAGLTFAILQNSLSTNPPAPSQTVIDSSQSSINSAAQTQPVNTPQVINTTPVNTVSASHTVDWRQIAFSIWIVGVSIMLIRAMSTIAAVSKLRKDCSPVSDSKLLSVFGSLQKTVCPKRNVMLLTSNRITIPCVIGALKPAILLPASILTSIPTDDLQAILAHELAHIRRHDYLINFCQMVIEAFLFFNPAMWWVSRCIRTEREASCDAATVHATGQKLPYARALANFASRITQPDSPAIAFGKPDSQNSILDRVKRLLISNHRPSIKFSWPTSIIILLASIAVLLAHQKTTNQTIKYIGKLLTPQQRIEKIEQIQEQYSKPNFTSHEPVIITGAIKTEDGKHPIGWKLNAYIKYSAYSCDKYDNKQPEDDKFSFSTRLYPGRTWLHCRCPGYADYIQPIDFEPGDQIDSYEIILNKGFTANIKVTDQSNAPIADASIKAGFKIGSSSNSNPVNDVTNANGIAQLSNIIDHPMSIDIVAAGYEEITGREVTFSPTKTHVFILNTVESTTGIVFDAITNKPVADAEIRIVMKVKQFSSASYGLDPEVATKTDKRGYFALNSLEKNAKYFLLVSAPDYGGSIIPNVIAGQKEITTTLPPPFKINGTIIGDLSKLSTGDVRVNGKTVIGSRIRLNYSLVFGNYSRDDFTYALVTIDKEGVGRFEVDNLLANRILFICGDREAEKLLIEKGKYDYDISIDLDKQITINKRKVIVNLIQPEGMPAPKGKVSLLGRSGWSKVVDIVNGTGSVEVEVPVELTCQMDGYRNARIMGYWFSNMYDYKKVIQSDKPCQFNIPVKPAGSIYGNITDASGNNIYNSTLSMSFICENDGFYYSSGGLSETLGFKSGKEGKYNAYPIPFTSRCRIRAEYHNYMMLSPEIIVSEENPIVEYNFQMKESIDLRGRIIKPDSTPSINTNYALHVIGGPVDRILLQRTTDSDGNFIFTNVNPSKDFKYKLVLRIDNNGKIEEQQFDLKTTESPQTFKLK